MQNSFLPFLYKIDGLKFEIKRSICYIMQHAQQVKTLSRGLLIGLGFDVFK